MLINFIILEILQLIIVIVVFIVKYKQVVLQYKRKLRANKEHIKYAILGQEIEQLIPFSKGFKYNPKDAIFIGSPIDFIVFDGLSDGNLRRIIFIEVKTNSSKLSKNEKMISEIIAKNYIAFDKIKIDTK